MSTFFYMPSIVIEYAKCLKCNRKIPIAQKVCRECQIKYDIKLVIKEFRLIQDI